MSITLGLKVRGLSKILALRGAISNEEAETMGIIYFFKTKGDITDLQDKALDLLAEDLQSEAFKRECTPEEKRLYARILYQPNFMEEVRRKYEDYIEPFAKKASWIYITKKLGQALKHDN